MKHNMRPKLSTGFLDVVARIPQGGWLVGAVGKVFHSPLALGACIAYLP